MEEKEKQDSITEEKKKRDSVGKQKEKQDSVTEEKENGDSSRMGGEKTAPPESSVGNPGNVEEKKSAKRRMRDNFRPEYTRISFYVILTVMIIYFLIRFFDHVGNVFGAIGSGISWLGVITRPLILGLVFAYLLYPMVNFFEKQLDKLKDRMMRGKPQRAGRRRSSRGLAVAITCVIVALIIFVVLSLVVSTITSQLSVISMDSFDTIAVGFVNNLNELARNIESVLHKLNISSVQINDIVNQAGNTLSDSIEKIASQLIGSIKNLPSFFSMLLFAIIFGIYFMVDGEGLKKYWGHVFRTIAGRKGRKYLEEFAREADRVFSGYIRGQLIDALFMAVAVSITLSVIGVKYAIIIGVLTGIGNLIPYVGPFVAYGSTAIVCLLNWNLQRFIVAMVTLFILQTIDGNVVNPKLLGNSIRIHPVLVIVSLLIGEKVGGLLGMVIAVPCGGLLKVYFEKMIAYMANRKKAAAMKRD
ncbi:MAG: AI-2E family transporter [Bilifractor sp.]|nr:AI-2E family transporter [Lachnospiraceae bacterium]MDY2837960.1 AI-2E family transporter [Bilifractor sp.]